VQAKAVWKPEGNLRVVWRISSALCSLKQI